MKIGNQPSAISAVWATDLGVTDAIQMGMWSRTGSKRSLEAAFEFEDLARVHQRLLPHDHVDDVDVLAQSRERPLELHTMKVPPITRMPELPSPMIMRPPESSSSVAKCCASAPGLRE